MEPIVEVKQADRDAAASLLGKLSNSAQEDWALSMMRLGKHDDADIVQAMATHRLSTPSPDLKADNAALVEALKRIASDHVGDGRAGYGAAPANHMYHVDCDACHRQAIARAALQATEPRP